MTTNAAPLPASLRGAAWTSALAWLPLLAGLLVLAVPPTDFSRAVPMVASVAVWIAGLFVASLAAALVASRRPCVHVRAIAHATAAASMFGAVAAGALFAFTIAAAPAVAP